MNFFCLSISTSSWNELKSTINKNEIAGIFSEFFWENVNAYKSKEKSSRIWIQVLPAFHTQFNRPVHKEIIDATDSLLLPNIVGSYSDNGRVLNIWLHISKCKACDDKRWRISLSSLIVGDGTLHHGISSVLFWCFKSMDNHRPLDYSIGDNAMNVLVV